MSENTQEEKLVRTVQETSKKWKAQLLCCWVLAIVSFSIIANSEDGAPNRVFAFVFVGAICWWIVVKFLIWWNHK